MPFEALMRIAGNIGNDLKASAKKFQNKGTMERAAAACACVAYLPDKDADKDEIKKGVQAIHRMTDQAFDIAAMTEAVNEAVSTLEFDEDMGYGELLAKMKKAGPDERDLLIRTAIAVGKSSGEEGEDPFSPAEKDCVRRMISDLGLSADTFGL